MLKLTPPPLDKSESDNPEVIIDIDISYNLNLFYMTLQDDTYRIYVLDMDDFQVNHRPLLKYRANDVNKLSFTHLYVRSSSSKES